MRNSISDDGKGVIVCSLAPIQVQEKVLTDTTLYGFSDDKKTLCIVSDI